MGWGSTGTSLKYFQGRWFDSAITVAILNGINWTEFLTGSCPLLTPWFWSLLHSLCHTPCSSFLTLGSPAPCLLPAKYRQFLPPKSLSLTCCNSYSSPQISIASKNWNPFVHLYKEMQWFSYVLPVNGHVIWHNLSDSLTTYLPTYVIYQYLQLVCRKDQVLNSSYHFGW